MKPRYRLALTGFEQVAVQGFTTYSCYDSGLIFFGDYEESATFIEEYQYSQVV